MQAEIRDIGVVRPGVDLIGFAPSKAGVAWIAYSGQKKYFNDPTQVLEFDLIFHISADVRWEHPYVIGKQNSAYVIFDGHRVIGSFGYVGRVHVSSDGGSWACETGNTPISKRRICVDGAIGVTKDLKFIPSALPHMVSVMPQEMKLLLV